MDGSDLILPQGLEFVSVVAEGGFGVIIKALQRSTNRYVALKFLKDCDKGLQARFRREARVLAKLSHPNIVQFIDFQKSNGQYFILSEFVDGEDLDKLLARSGTVPLATVQQMGKGLLSALHEAHQLNIIHRDLKPSNILISKRGEWKLADFGIAAHRDIEGTLTKTGIILGTPSYMSPEQIKGTPVDKRTDIYSFGVILFQMLAGQLPFKDKNVATLLESHLHREPPMKELSHLPKNVQCLIASCLHKDPNNRPSSAQRLAHSLCQPIDEPALRKQNHKTVTIKKSSSKSAGTNSRWPRRLLVASSFALPLLCLLFVFFIAKRQKEPESPQSTNVLVVERHGLGTYRSIAKAIAVAPEGKTIRVAPNTYVEKQVKTNGNFTLTSPSKNDRAIIRFTSSPGLIITSGSLTLKNFVFQSKQIETIEIRSGKLILENCEFDVKNRAIVASGKSSLLQIKECLLRSRGTVAVEISNEARAHIEKLDLTATSAKYGLHFFQSGPSSVAHSKIASSLEGILHVGPARLSVSDCQFLGCRDHGMLIRYGKDFKATNCEVINPGGFGVEIVGGTGQLENVTVFGAVELALALNEGCKVQLSNCRFVNNKSGATICNSQGWFKTCHFTKNKKQGLRILRKGTAVVENSIISDNESHGLIIKEDSTGHFKYCQFSRNKYIGCRVLGRGTFLSCSMNSNKVSGLRASDNSVGKMMESTAANNARDGFSITDNSDFEIEECTSKRNKRFNLHIKDAAKVECKKCLFSKSSTSGIYVQSTQPCKITDCRIEHNKKYGIELDRAQLHMHGTTIRKNKIGLFISNSKAKVIDSSFRSNKVMHISGSHSWLTHNKCRFDNPKQVLPPFKKW